MDLGLKGKVAIVAASSKGMGRATAMGLAAEGARVTMLARGEAELLRASEEIRERCQAEVLAVPADVTRAQDITRVVQKTVGRWGRVDILVSNAGGPPPGVFDDMDDSKWQSAFELNLLSTIRLVREVLPHMRRAGGGAIINLQSISVKVPVDNLILSNSIRSGVIGLAKSLSVELARDRTRVNTVLPGLIMIVFLASDRARYVTGVTVQVDGGVVRSIM